MGSSQTAVDVGAEALASWLEQQPPAKLWTVDGEETLAGAISFPCAGEELAELIRALGKLRVFSSAEGLATYSKSHDLAALAQDDGEGLVFAVGSATDDTPHWLLVEDKLAEAAYAATG